MSGLSRPIPLLSFEFNTNPGLIEIAEKCTSYIGKLGGYEFNYQAEASGETAVQFTKWVNPSVMLYTLRHDLARKEMFGDIFARLKEPVMSVCDYDPELRWAAQLGHLA